MMNVVRVVLFPIAVLAATYYTCYDIFWWAVVEGDDPWVRKNLKRLNPIQDFADLFRDPKKVKR